MRSPADPAAVSRLPRAVSEDDLPPGVTSAQQEEEYRALLADGFFDPEPFDECPEPGFWGLAAAVRYGDLPIAS